MAKILLVYPTMRLLGFRFPYSLIPVANYLRHKGHEITIFDAQVENANDFSVDGYDMVGFSTLTGPQIRSSLDFARIAKEQNPEIPVVFGGVHPSLLPEQTVEHPLVDVVCVKEGEETMHELANALVEKRSLFGIQGIAFQHDGKVVRTPDRPFIDLNETPFLKFDLLKTERYVELQRNPRIIYYESSRGCPHRCGFCYDPVYHQRKWRAKSPERVVDEIAFLAKKYDIKKVWFTDDELAVSRKRLGMIAELMLKRDLQIKWPISARANNIARYSDDFLDLLRRAGCDHISFGVESGSDRLLELMQKDITIDQVIRSVENLKRANISCGLSFIIGFPTETVEEMRMSFDLIDRILAISDTVSIGQISAFTPLPGTDLMDVAEKAGFKAPQSLEEWADYYYNDPKNLNYLVPEARSLVKTVTMLSKFDFAANQYGGASIIEKRKILKLAHYTLWRMANFRWGRRLFAFPIEWRAVDLGLRLLKIGER